MEKETRSHVSSKRVMFADPEPQSTKTTNFVILVLLRYQHTYPETTELRRNCRKETNLNRGERAKLKLLENSPIIKNNF